MLLIAEEFLLLALDDESGKISYSGASSFPYGIVGGLLLDLLLRDRLALKDRVVKVVDSSSTGDPLLDDVLKRIGDLKRDLLLRSWIIQLSVTFRNVYSKGFLSRLTDQGMLVREEQPRLKIFHSMRHPLKEPAVKEELLQKLQGIILDKQEAVVHYIALLSLFRECGLIGSLVKSEYRSLAESRIKALLASENLPNKDREIIVAVIGALAGILFQPPYKVPRNILPKIFKKKSD